MRANAAPRVIYLGHRPADCHPARTHARERKLRDSGRERRFRCEINRFKTGSGHARHGTWPRNIQGL